MEEKEILAEVDEFKGLLRDGFEEEASQNDCFLHRMFFFWLARNGIVTSEHFEEFLEEYALWNIALEYGNSVEDEIVYGNA